MNPHNAAVRPGAHMVAEAFGVEDPWLLCVSDELTHPQDLVGKLVAEAAQELDDLQGQVTRAARSATGLLEPLGRGELAGMRVSNAMLQTAVPRIGQLIARHDAAYDQLTKAIGAYRRLPSAPDGSQSLPVPASGTTKAPSAGRDDDWAIAGDRQRRALEAAEAGALRFHQSAVHGYTYLSNGSGQRPNPEVWPETVQRLVADGLLDQDTSEALYRPGQLLSLTPQGEIALRDARTASPRVSAALSRSSTAVTASTAAEPAAATATSAPAKPSRSR